MRCSLCHQYGNEYIPRCAGVGADEHLPWPERHLAVPYHWFLGAGAVDATWVWSVRQKKQSKRNTG